MRTKIELMRPLTLEPGAACLWIESPITCKEPEVLPVWFVCHDPCPAFVIIRTPDGSRHRCPRDEIFTSPSPAPVVVSRACFPTQLEA